MCGVQYYRRGRFCIDADLAAVVLRYEEKLIIQTMLKDLVQLQRSRK